MTIRMSNSPLALGMSGVPLTLVLAWEVIDSSHSHLHPHSQGGFAGIKRSCLSSFGATGWRDVSPPWSPAINPAIWHTFVLVLTFCAEFDKTVWWGKEKGSWLWILGLKRASRTWMGIHFCRKKFLLYPMMSFRIGSALLSSYLALFPTALL